MAAPNKAVPPHLTGLNPPQHEAVVHGAGPILVLAGAGSGKTRVLTHRIVHLITEQSVRPRNILAVTFTNKATEEMRSRLSDMLGEHAKELWAATFHSTALRMLRRHAELLSYKNGFVVYDDQDSKAALKQVIKELQIDEKKYPPDLFHRMIDRAKNDFLSPEDYAKDNRDYIGSMNAEVYDRYQRSLRLSNAMDFGDLLVNSLLLLQKHPQVKNLYRETFHYILVDEFQDTNRVQYLFLREIAEPRRNLLVVGDDDQSIYSFRGASIENILNFEKDYPETKVVTLDQNYRSTTNILEAAHSVIVKNKGRKEKKLWTETKSEHAISTFTAFDETDEGHFIAETIADHIRSGGKPSEVAVFYRTNAQSRAIEEALVEKRIPYRIFGGLRFYERKEVKDVLAYFKLVINPSDNQSFLRVLNTPPRGIGAQTANQIVKHAEINQSSFWDAACSVPTKSKSLALFVALINKMRELATNVSLYELIASIIEESGYLARLKDSSEPTSQSRLENLKELQAIAASPEFHTASTAEAIQIFLDRASLTSGGDIPSEEGGEVEDKGSVSLMTLHLAKGLEFPLVFLTGLEEGLLPHYRSIQDPEQIEEERRLCYVGITRGMQQLYLSRTMQRGMFSAGDGLGNMGRWREPSRFIYDIPRNLLESKGGDFFAEGGWAKEDDIEDDDDTDSEELVTGFRSKRKAKKKNKGWLDLLVKSADDIS